MKKVINWTFGSFFRTLGRTFAILGIGILIGYILLKSGFKLPKFFPIMTVNAEVIYNGTDNPTYLRSAIRGFTTTGTGPNYQGYYGEPGTVGKFTKDDVILNNDNNDDISNGIYRNLGLGGYHSKDLLSSTLPEQMHDLGLFYQLEFLFGNYPASGKAFIPKGYNYRLNILVASGSSVDISSDGWYYPEDCGISFNFYQGKYQSNSFGCNNSLSFKKTNNGGNLTWLSWSYNDESDVGKTVPNTNSRVSMGFPLYIRDSQYIFNNDTSVQQFGQKDWFYILDYKFERVPADDYTYDDSILTFDYPNVTNNIWQNEEFVYTIDSGSGGSDTPTEPPETTNEDINNSINDMNDSINNDNIDGANNDANSFFEGFTSEDNGGLSGIITAPLNSINAMLSDSCSPLTTSFKGKEIMIPCGTDFYNSMGEVRTFLNMLEGGILSYLILRKLYFLIHKLKNPEDDRVEVMNL